MAVPTVFSRLLLNSGKFLEEFKGQPRNISAGVAAVGEAADYAEVWEWGNIRQTKQGPKTILGTNPDGDSVWLSVQAPFGYIRVHASMYWDIYREELDKLDFSPKTAKGIQEQLERAHKNAAVRCAVIISNSAPVDSGQLAGSIEAVAPGDEILAFDFNEEEESI